MEHLKLRRSVQLKYWIEALEDISKEFPGNNINIDTAIRSFKSQIKELEKQNEKNSKGIETL